MLTTRVLRAPADANIFVARQPIFDRNRNVMAYELLFRSGLEDCFGNQDADLATARVIVDSFFQIGMGVLTEGKPAFINFPQHLLLENVALALPSDLLVVEILETVRPESGIVEACKALKQSGFRLALDDVVYLEGWEPLLEVVDIVKVDFMQSDASRRRELARELLPRGLKLLAEKVESESEFSEGLGLGFCYFQGYFFKRPVVIATRGIPVSVSNYLELLRVFHQPDFDLTKVENLIRRDVGLSYKLLRYINSAAFPWVRTIGDLRHMMVALGTENLKRFLSLLILSALVCEKPTELIRASLLRAYFCELLGLKQRFESKRDDLFFMGMFSLMDAILDRSLEETLGFLPLSSQVKEAIAGSDDQLGLVLKVVKSYEEARWENAVEGALKVGVSEQQLPSLYFQAVQQTQALMIE